MKEQNGSPTPSASTVSNVDSESTAINIGETTKKNYKSSGTISKFWNGSLSQIVSDWECSRNEPCNKGHEACKQYNENQHGHIYLVKDEYCYKGENEEFTNALHIKIGSSIDVDSRITTLKTGNTRLEKLADVKMEDKRCQKSLQEAEEEIRVKFLRDRHFIKDGKENSGPREWLWTTIKEKRLNSFVSEMINSNE